jgi:hypothetical protein
MLLIQMTSFADHITVSGDVSGEWNTDTILVTGNLTVPDGHNLLIQPGTIVEFLGSFTFNIKGSVSAIGLMNDNIFFQVADTTGFILPEYDLAGNLRIFNDIIDIGAYEWWTVGVNDQLVNDSPVKVWPNPFMDQICIEFNLEMSEDVVVEIFELAGRKTSTIYKGNLPGGNHILDWQCLDMTGQAFLLRVSAGDQTFNKNLNIRLSRPSPPMHFRREAWFEGIQGFRPAGRYPLFPSLKRCCCQAG